MLPFHTLSALNSSDISSAILNHINVANEITQAMGSQGIYEQSGFLILLSSTFPLTSPRIIFTKLNQLVWNVQCAH